ncbi:MAG: hypothetical protein ABW318_27505 [Vicinamibacterales bacterium]
MTKLEILKMLAQDLGATTKQAIAKATEPLLARISDLEDRIFFSGSKPRSIHDRRRWW